MTYDSNSTLPEEFLEPILEHGLDVLPELIETLRNAQAKFCPIHLCYLDSFPETLCHPGETLSQNITISR